MKKLYLMLMAIMISALSASAQTRTVQGVVIDGQDNEPIVGATVIPEGHPSMGTATNIDGEFTLNIPTSIKKLTISYVGMVTKSVDITPGVMNITLESTATGLDEVMVVAYGTVKKSEYTGSAAVVDADQLQTALVSDATAALAGRVSGVQVQSANGQPGSAPTVLIRGIGSINGSKSPLYVVDGVPFNGDVNQIPATDIESMTVLKDAASTALYGARGANGVILITTKSGSNNNKVTVNVDARWGVNQRGVADYDLVKDERTYMEMVYQALYNSNLYYLGRSPLQSHVVANNSLWGAIGFQTWTAPEGQDFVGVDGKFNPMATRGYIANGHLFRGDDWIKESFHNKLRQEYNVSVSGGTDKLAYYASLSYLGDEGIINSSSFNRLNTTLNVDYQVKKWLKIGANMAYTYTRWNYPSEQTSDDSNSSGNVFGLAYQYGPMYPFYVREPDGSISIDPATGKHIYSYGDNEYGFSRNVQPGANPAGNFAYNFQQYISDIFRGKWFVLLQPIDGLDITGTIGYHVDNTQYQGYDNPWYGQFASYGGIAEQDANRSRSIDEQIIAQYSRSFNEVNNFSLMLGWEHDSYQYTALYGYGYNLYQPGNFTINNTMTDTRQTGGYQYNLAHMGWFGRLNYNYDGKYFAMVSFRRDGSSRFAPEHRWGNFWSASAAWDMAKESWLRDVENVDLLKVKASFGQNGNDNLNLAAPYGYLPYQDFYDLVGSDGVWSDGTLLYKGNRDITWEKSSAFNIGVDYAFFNNKLNGSVEYFSRQTTDMLMNVPTSPSLGYSSIPMNVGSMRNSGLEVEINYNPIRTQDWDWNINLNFTVPENKVLKLEKSLLNDKGEWISGTRYFKEGQSMYQLTLAKYAGVDPKTGYEQFWAKDAQTGEEYLTAEGSTARSTNATPVGNMLPKIYGGFSTTLRWRGFDLSVALSFQLGGRIFDTSYQRYMYVGESGSLGDAFHKDMLNAWTPENANSNVPMLISDSPYSANGSNGNYYYSDRWLTSSNYLSLNNITFGYTLPTSATKKIGMNEIRVYFAAENVALATARKGMDPRQGYVSTTNQTYSALRTLTGGIHISF